MAQPENLVFDVVDATATHVMNQVKTQELKSTLIPLYDTSNRIASLIDLVINAAGRRASIGVLRLWGHGMLSDSPGGYAAFGAGGFDLDMMLKPSTQIALPRLKPYFATGARVEFKHCRVGTPAGWDWLSHLAHHWGVEIHASDAVQFFTTWSGDVYSFRAGRKPVLVEGVNPK